jgi:hypothetical protein
MATHNGQQNSAPQTHQRVRRDQQQGGHPQHLGEGVELQEDDQPKGELQAEERHRLGDGYGAARKGAGASAGDLGRTMICVLGFCECVLWCG